MAQCGDVIRCTECGRDPRDHAEGCSLTDTFEFALCEEEGTILVMSPSGPLTLCPVHAAFYPAIDSP
jgi:hypothetical protein